MLVGLGVGEVIVVGFGGVGVVVGFVATLGTVVHLLHEGCLFILQQVRTRAAGDFAVCLHKVTLDVQQVCVVPQLQGGS